MEYLVQVEIPTIYKINAKNKEEAIQQVKDSLIAQKVIKPADFCKIDVIEEVK